MKENSCPGTLSSSFLFLLERSGGLYFAKFYFILYLYFAKLKPREIYDEPILFYIFILYYLNLKSFRSQVFLF